MAQEFEHDHKMEAGKEVAAGPEGVVPERGGDVVGSWRNFLKSAVVALAATGVYGTADGDDPKQPAAVASATSDASEATKKDSTKTRVQRITTKTVMINAEDLVPEEMKVTLEQWEEIENLIRSQESRTNRVLYKKSYGRWYKAEESTERRRLTTLFKARLKRRIDPALIEDKLLRNEDARAALVRSKEQWAGELNTELEEQGIGLRFCAGLLSEEALQLHHPILSLYEVPGASNEQIATRTFARFFRAVKGGDINPQAAVQSANREVDLPYVPFRFYLAPDGKTPLIDWKGQEREKQAKQRAAEERKRLRSETKKTPSAGSGGSAK